MQFYIYLGRIVYKRNSIRIVIRYSTRIVIRYSIRYNFIASQTLTSGDVTLHVLEINSYVSGYHAYMYRPYNLAPRFSQYLRREVNKAFAEVTGEKVNKGSGYGLEIPCVYRLHGPKVYIDKMKEFLKD